MGLNFHIRLGYYYYRTLRFVGFEKSSLGFFFLFIFSLVLVNILARFPVSKRSQYGVLGRLSNFSFNKLRSTIYVPPTSPKTDRVF